MNPECTVLFCRNGDHCSHSALGVPDTGAEARHSGAGARGGARAHRTRARAALLGPHVAAVRGGGAQRGAPVREHRAHLHRPSPHAGRRATRLFNTRKFHRLSKPVCSNET